MPLVLHIVSWSAWAPGVESRAAWERGDAPDPAVQIIPEVKFIDAMTRRRLGRLARMTLQVAYAAVGTHTGPLRMVYASQHGDLRQTLSLLTALAQQEPLSPTAFGLSVHNAIPGIWSLLRKDHSAVTAIASGAQTFYAGLLEAALQSQERPEQPVLYVYADDEVPSPYNQQTRPLMPQAIALVLGQPAEQVLNFPQQQELADMSAFVRRFLVGKRS